MRRPSFPWLLSLSLFACREVAPAGLEPTMPGVSQERRSVATELEAELQTPEERRARTASRVADARAAALLEAEKQRAALAPRGQSSRSAFSQ